jgi:Protein kinase domain
VEPAKPTDVLPAGLRLGPYQVLGPLGEGGMGRVYRALDTRLERLVAIKVSDERFSQRFEREARSVSALNHPNICTLYDLLRRWEALGLREIFSIKQALRSLDGLGEVADFLAVVISRDQVVARDIAAPLTVLRRLIETPKTARAFAERVDVGCQNS